MSEMAGRLQLIVDGLVDVLSEWNLEPDEADGLLEDAKGEYRAVYGTVEAIRKALAKARGDQS